MKPSITVLHVLPELASGGAERLALELATASIQQGDKAYIASMGGALVAELVARGGVHLSFPAHVKNPFSILINAFRLKNLVKKLGVAIVHIHSRAPAWSGVLARYVGMKAKIVTTHHGTYTARNSLKRWYNSGIVRGDAVIAHSNFIADLIRYRHPFASDNIHVIPAGIDTVTFDPLRVDEAHVTALRTSWNIPEGNRIVLHPARLTPWKGQRVLIEAAALLNDGTVSFVLAGDAQGRERYAAELDTLISARGLKDQVVRVGSVNDIATAYGAATVAAFPSTQAEAFGLAVVEAQAMGVPVVVADHGAPVETVVADALHRTGWRVNPDDAKGLADGLRAALSASPQDLASIATNARKHVLAHYSLAVMTALHLELYQTLRSQ